MKKYLVIFTGISLDEVEIDLKIIPSDDSVEQILVKAIESKGFDLKDDEDFNMARELLYTAPIGIAELEEDNSNPEIEWFYDLP